MSAPHDAPPEPGTDRLARAIAEWESFQQRQEEGSAESESEFIAARPQLRDFLILLVGAEEEETVDARDGNSGESAAEPRAEPDPDPGDWALPRVGQRFGSYHLLSELGRGGMGVVFLADDTKLSRRVALKLILPYRLLGRTAIRRFRREARAAASLDHPSICGIYDVDTVNGLPYIAMQYIDGQDLAAKIEAEKAVGPGHANRTKRRRGSASGLTEDVRAIVTLGLEVAEALHHAHEQLVFHRDVKPANILIDADGHANLLDFGLASVRSDDVSALTESRDRLGTPAFMAPEQLEASGKVGPGIDIWALGVTLFEALTLQRPFAAVSTSELEDAILNTAPPRADRCRPGISRDLGTVIEKCLQKSPEQRYASCRVVAEELGRVLRDEPILAQPVSRLRSGVRWCRRNPFPTALIASLVLLCTVTLIAVWAFRDLDRERVRAELAVAASDFAAGQASAARGEWRRAIDSYDAALVGGHEAIPCLLARLRSAEHLGNDHGRQSAAAKTLEELYRQPGGALLPAVVLTHADPTRRIVVTGQKRPSLATLRELRDKSAYGPSDSAYIDALLSESVAVAIEHLERAVLHVNRNKLAREMLVATRFVLDGGPAARSGARALSERYPADRRLAVLAAICQSIDTPDAASASLSKEEQEIVNNAVQMRHLIEEVYVEPLFDFMRVELGAITKSNALLGNAWRATKALKLAAMVATWRRRHESRPVFRLPPALSAVLSAGVGAVLQYSFRPEACLSTLQQTRVHGRIGVFEYVRAVLHFRRGEHEQAAAAFASAASSGGPIGFRVPARIMAARRLAELGEGATGEARVKAMHTASSLVAQVLREPDLSALSLSSLAHVSTMIATREFPSPGLELAQEAAARLRRSFPNDPNGHVYLSIVALGHGERHKARFYLDAAAKLAPDDPRIRQFRKALEKKPKDR